MRPFIIATLFILLGSLNMPALVSAVDLGQEYGAPPQVSLTNPIQGGGTLESLLRNILSFVITLGTVVIVIMVVFIGYKFVVAQGNGPKITEAKTMLLWTVIGALVLLGAQAITDGIMATVQALK